MATTPLLGITQVTPSQNNKEVTINDAIGALENATNAKLVVDFSAATTVLLSNSQLVSAFIFEATGATASSTLELPTTINTNPVSRIIAVRNISGEVLKVQFNGAPGVTVDIPNNETRLLAAMEGTDVIVAAEPQSTVSFVSLNDTPGTLTGQAGRFLSANLAENALEFVDAAVFPAYTDNAGKYLVVNSGEDGVEWVDLNIVTTFLGLADAPSDYTGQGGRYVVVNGAENGVEFIDLPDLEAVEFVAAQRWRLSIDTPGSDPQVGFGEIQWLDVDGTNLVGSGTASASNEETGNEASFAFDGSTNPGNGWLTEDTFVGAIWIEYDFGTPVTPRTVRLFPVNNFPDFTPLGFTIEYWNGASWVNAGARTTTVWGPVASQAFKINGQPLTSIPEAPNNGTAFVRKSAAWVQSVINDHSDVDTAATPPMAGQTLIWNAVDSLWEPGDVAQSINDLTDVNTTSSPPSEGQVLAWDNNAGEWVPRNPEATGAVFKARAASTANVVLASELENGDALDGVTLATGDRVLLKDQTTGEENGIYVVQASGAAVRAEDADEQDKLISYAVFIAEGAVNADKFFQCTTDAPITVDTTVLSWAEVAGATPSIATLTDTDTTTNPPTAGQTLVWNDNTSRWEPGTPVAGIGDLTDVDTTTAAPAAGQILVWNDVDSVWEPADPASVVTESVVVSTETSDLANTQNTQYIRFTSGNVKTLNVRTDANHAIDTDAEFHLHNEGGNNLTVVPATGVTITPPPSGSLSIPTGGTATLKRVATDSFDLMGVTVGSGAAPVSGFDDLDDTPNAYTGQAGRYVVVKNAEDGLEFVDLPTNSATFRARAASTANVDIATELENGDTLDGVTLVTGDRVLIKDQTAPAENGVYVVQATGAAIRSEDADSEDELINYALFVSEGTINEDTFWNCTTDAPITVDTTALTFAQVSGASGASAINGLTDVDTSTTPPTDGQALLWDNVNSVWVPGDVEASGGIGAAAGDVLYVAAMAEFSTPATPSLDRSINVASVVRTDTGRYRINFTTAFSDTNYEVLVQCRFNDSANDTIGIFGIDRRSGQGRATTHVDITGVPVSPSAVDPSSDNFEYVRVTVLRRKNVAPALMNALKGGRMEWSANQSIGNNTQTKAAPNVTVFDTESAWDALNSRVVVPAGVTHAQVDFFLYHGIFSANDVFNTVVQFDSAGNALRRIYNGTTSVWGGKGGTLGTVPVSEGHYFEVYGQVQGSGQIIQAANPNPPNEKLSHISWQFFNESAPVLGSTITETGTSANLSSNNAGFYQRWTATGAKTLTVQPNATEAISQDAEFTIANRAASGNLTILTGSGVTINVPTSGGLVLEPGMVATLKRVAEDEYDLL